jgi:hypothetical protein
MIRIKVFYSMKHYFLKIACVKIGIFFNCGVGIGFLIIFFVKQLYISVKTTKPVSLFRKTGFVRISIK